MSENTSQEPIKTYELHREANRGRGTIWIDGETPVNAENMNKIESRLNELENTAVTQNNICLDEGTF